MAQISFDRASSQDVGQGSTREWLVTNGLGGYASGTVVGINTRRYHGLLIAAIKPPVQRTALLVRIYDSVTVDDQTADLLTAQYLDGTVFPEGYKHIDSFVLDDGVPTWSLTVGNALLRRSLWMIPDHNITVLRYKLVVAGDPVELALRPLVAARDHHAEQHGYLAWHYGVEPVEGGVRIQATPNRPSLWLLAHGAAFHPAGDWYWNFLLSQERVRGYSYIEDLYQPGTFRATLLPGASLTLIASAEDPAQGLPDPDIALAEVRTRRAHITAAQTPSATAGRYSWVRDLADALAAAAEQFIVRRTAPGPVAEPQVSLIAGYHWFADWGRDAMIGLPGILVCTGRIAAADALLRTFAAHIDQGMIPSRFPESGEPPEHSAADATLWFFQALRATLEAGGAVSLLDVLYPRLREIVEWHQRGTRFGIGVDPQDGLLRAGQPGTQLTWMDARSGDALFTPRVGKPVEINALWIDALALMAGWASRCGDEPEPYRRAADRARESFARRFWYEAGGYLYDVVDGPDGDDPSLRPNQLIALALREPLLPADQARMALEVISAQLLTPYGLRTLSPDDPRYVGRCVGDQPARDRAYHQGTVWPWLLGPYADAHRRVHGSSAAIAALLEPFREHLCEAGLGTVSEIFDGDVPHTPRGCIAQGWSVAELLRIARSLEEAAD